MAGAQLYKVITGGRSHAGDVEWPLPGPRRRGAWVKHTGKLEMCASGLHLTTSPGPWVFGVRGRRDDIYTAEARGPAAMAGPEPGTVCAREARLVRALSDAEARELLVTQAAESVPDIRSARAILAAMAGIAWDGHRSGLPAARWQEFGAGWWVRSPDWGSFSMTMYFTHGVVACAVRRHGSRAPHDHERRFSARTPPETIAGVLVEWAVEQASARTDI